MRVGLDPARPHVDVCRFRLYGFAICCCLCFMHVAVLDVRELCCCFGLYVVVIGHWHIVFKTHLYFVSPPSICCVGYFVFMILISLLWPWPAM